MAFRLLHLRARPLSVPLVEPFVIATGRVDVTPNVLVEIELLDEETGRVATGLGEAATLSPVTRETQEEVLAALAAPVHEVVDPLSAAMPVPGSPCASQGLATAMLDAFARLRGVPAFVALGGAPGPAPRLVTDMTIPIGDPAHMVELARGWAARGFTCFKVKIGRDPDADLRALEGIHRAVPGATFRLDANAAFSAAVALSVARDLVRLGLAVECYEQPCAKDDLDGLAQVTREVPFDVVADESCGSVEDVRRLAAARAVDGVNLKLAKFGSVRAAFDGGVLARREGLSIMVGSMVETRLGVTAAAHLAAALGGVEYPDLDTAWLLADDPFAGGYEADGPRYALPDRPGLALRLAGG